MTSKTHLSLCLDSEVLVYVKETAAMQGLSIEALVEVFIDQGMKRIAQDEEDCEKTLKQPERSNCHDTRPSDIHQHV